MRKRHKVRVGEKTSTEIIRHFRDTRYADKEEVLETIRTGEKIPVKNQRWAYRKNFQFNKKWGKKFYRLKQIMPIVKEEHNRIIVITVYTFYF